MNVSPSRKSNGVVRNTSGSFTGDGTAVVINLGFNPSRFVLVNVTDTVKLEKYHGMAANASLRIAGTPAVAIVTGSEIVFNGDGTVTVSAAAAGSGKACVFSAG